MKKKKKNLNQVLLLQNLVFIDYTWENSPPLLRIYQVTIIFYLFIFFSGCKVCVYYFFGGGVGGKFYFYCFVCLNCWNLNRTLIYYCYFASYFYFIYFFIFYFFGLGASYLHLFLHLINLVYIYIYIYLYILFFSNCML